MMDLRLSKEVAKKAGKEITRLKKHIKENKDLHINLLYDVVNDSKKENKFIKKIIYFLFTLIFISLIGGFVCNIIHNKQMYELLEKTKIVVENHNEEFQKHNEEFQKLNNDKGNSQ